MAYYIVALGSNLGNRRLNLSRAVQRIAARYGDFEISHVVESASHGYHSDHTYLNAVMMFQSDDEPLRVLDSLQQIEREVGGPDDHHRDENGNYTDRMIDIDILAIDDRMIESERLTVPHPRMAGRSFVLEPLSEIAAGWRHPVSGLTPGDMLALLPKKEDNGND